MIEEKVVNNMLNESSYIKGLYEIFSLINSLIDGDFESNKSFLNKLENDIYTVNNKVYTEQKKISNEIKKIIRVNEGNTNLENKKIITKKIQNIMELMDEIFDNQVNENYIVESFKEKYESIREDAVFSIKKKISIIESELDIPINFFEAASYAFVDLYKKYRNSYKKDYLLSKEKVD